MTINIIVAVCGPESAIGRAGDMLYHLRDDLRNFKARTMGFPVVMGRKTYESLPKRPLPGRLNVVITRNSDYDAGGAVVAGSLEAAIAACKDADKVFVIGGAQMYAEAMNIADRLIVTYIDAPVPADADTFFPRIDPAVWHEQTRTESLTDSATGLRYCIVEYTR